MIEGLWLLANMTDEAREPLLRTFSHHRRSKPLVQDKKALTPILHEMLKVLSASPQTDDCNSTVEASRSYPHGECSFGVEFNAQAQKYPGPRCVMITTDQEAVYALQQAGAAHVGVDVDAFRRVEVAGAQTLKGKWKQQGCGKPDTKEQTKATSWSVNRDDYGRLVSMEGGFAGSPQQLHELMHQPSTPSDTRCLYEKSTVVYLPGGWAGLCDLVDSNGDPPPIEMCRVADFDADDDVVTEAIDVNYFGITGPWHVPLFMGGNVLVRIGSQHKVFKIRDYDHWLCLLALFGLLWFSFC